MLETQSIVHHLDREKVCRVKKKIPLLRRCIEKYGEGKWHLVPHRAGLNRCRRSCRRRWVNYLSPDIKRGRFTLDEDDLIIRLHKLLGNRWSLIAGRFPGRTANDVKNHGNTHLQKQQNAGGEGSVEAIKAKAPETIIFKHRARSFSKKATCLDVKSLETMNTAQDIQIKDQNFTSSSSTSSSMAPDNFNMQWFSDSLVDNEIWPKGQHGPSVALLYLKKYFPG